MRSFYYARPRVTKIVEDGIQQKLMIVWAPAGYGKTSVVQQSLDVLGVNSIWCCAIRRDNNTTLFRRFVQSQQIQHTNGDKSPLTWSDDEVVGINALTRYIEGSVESDPNTDRVIVVDDCHWFASEPSIVDAVNHMISNSSANAHFILIGRSVPNLACSCYLALEHRLVLLGLSDLRFNSRESRSILRSMHGKQITNRHITYVADTCDGWIAGIVLYGFHLVEMSKNRDLVLTTYPDLLFEYLSSEVFCTQPEPTQLLLLATSIVDSFCIELCNALLDQPDSDVRISNLVDQSVFIERLPEDPSRFRYHQLFLIFLRHQLNCLIHSSEWKYRQPCSLSISKNELIEWHRRASHWYNTHGLMVEHIRHMILAGDELAAAQRMTEIIGSLYVDGSYRDVISLATQFTEDILKKHPVLLYRLAGAYVMTGDLETALDRFDQAVAHLDEVGDNAILSKVLIGRAEPLQLLGAVTSATADLKRAISLAGDLLTRVRAQRLLAHCMIASNDLDKAEELLTQTLSDVGTANIDYQKAMVHTDSSMLYHLSGRFDKAIEHAMISISLWKNLDDLGGYSLALNNLGTAYHAQGYLELAKYLLLESHSLAESSGVWRYRELSLLSLADVYADQGDLVGACSAYEVCVRSLREQQSHSLTVYGITMWADAMRLRRDLVGARRLLVEARSFDVSSVEKSTIHLMEYTQGALALDESDYDRAVRSLDASFNGFLILGKLRETLRCALYGAAVAWLTNDSEGFEHWKHRITSIAPRGFPSLTLQVDVKRVEKYLDRKEARQRSLISRIYDLDEHKDDRVYRSVSRDKFGIVNQNASVSILALGPPMIVLGDEFLETRFQTRSARDMLFYLIDSKNGRSQYELMSVFWPNSTDRRARSALQSTLTRIRKAVGNDVLESDGERYFVPRDSTLYYDVDDFYESLTLAETAESNVTAIKSLMSGLNLVRGEYLEGINAEWIVERRWYYERIVIRALTMLADAQLQNRQWKEAALSLQQLIDHDPVMESAYRKLMHAYAANGDRAKALAVYSELANVLRRDLNVEPDPRSAALHQVIRERGIPP